MPVGIDFTAKLPKPHPFGLDFPDPKNVDIRLCIRPTPPWRENTWREKAPDTPSLRDLVFQRMQTSKLKRLIVTLVKIGFAVGILAFLIVQAQHHDSFAGLRNGPKRWDLLLAAWACTLVEVALSFVRWFLLVRALGLPFRLSDAFRLGFLGYLLNLVSLGLVGGDLFKALMIAREQPGRRTEAVATVFIDRLLGLYALFLVATTAILLGDLGTSPPGSVVRMLCDSTLVLTCLGAVGICLLLVPGFTGGRVSQWCGRLPLVGETMARLIATVRIYRSKLPTLLAVIVISMGIHSLLSVSIFLIARGLPGAAPSLEEHFLIAPVSMVAGALPATPSGLGTFEGAMEYLYRYVPTEAQVDVGKGVIVALAYRVIMVATAMIGVGYYLTSRREVAEVMHDAEAS